MPFLFSILIVEDEILIAQDLKEILEEVGYKNVFRAKNYKQAIEIIENQNIDLVLLDINLNDEMTGIDLAKYINKHKQMPIIYITSYSDSSTIANVKQTMPAAFLLKPYSKALLLAAIEIALFNYTSKINAAEKLVEDIIPDVVESDIVINKHLLVKENYHFIKIPLEEILWFESNKNYVEVKTRQKKYIIRSSLKRLLELLPPADFVKCYKQFIINIRHAKSFTSDTVLIHEYQIPISRNTQEEVFRKLKT
jgi:DNA-binding LytR/AlgR family response regulator